MMTAENWKARWGHHIPHLSGGRSCYAVLCPIAEVDGALHFLFEVRAASLKRQPGEVCFPGGQAAAGESAAVCALRETQEELRIPPEHITLLGQSDFLCSQSGFLLQPVLGLIQPEGLRNLDPSPDEVGDVFTAPVSFFLDTVPEIWSYTLEPQIPSDFPYSAVGIDRDYRWDRGKVDIPIWHYQGHTVWGMTARIIRDVLSHMKND